MDAYLKLSSVSKVYDKGKTTTAALKGVSLAISEGETVAIVGESGAGKSTMLSIMGLMDSPTEGEYCICNQNVFGLSEEEKAGLRNREIGFVLQEYGLIDYLTVEENVGFPLVYSGEKIKKAERAERIHSVLKDLGIASKRKELAGMLSGGQRQRVAIARALINNPKVVLADEPTSALDEKTKNEMMDLLLKAQKNNGNILIVVTHDAAVAKRMGRVVRLENGKIREDNAR